MKTFFSTIALCVVASSSSAQVCGDVDDTGAVTANDALAVLKSAVGIDVELTCDSGDCLALEARMDALEGSAVVLTDGEGQVLGRIVGDAQGGTSKTVFVESLGKVLELGYVADEDESGFPPVGVTKRAAPYFHSPLCEGTPFVIVDQSQWDANSVFYNSGRAFVVDSVRSKPHIAGSQLSESGACSLVGIDLSITDDGNHMAYDLVEVALPFTIPAPGPMQIVPLR